MKLCLFSELSLQSLLRCAAVLLLAVSSALPLRAATPPIFAAPVGIQNGGNDNITRVVTQMNRDANSDGKPDLTDFDGDGKPDVAFQKPTQPGVAVYFGSGMGISPSSSYDLSTFHNPPSDLAAGCLFGFNADDLAMTVDNDTYPDLVTIEGGRVMIYLNAGRSGTDWQGMSQYPVNQPAASTLNLKSVAVADLNGDGYDDIVAGGAATYSSGSQGVVAIYINKGAAAAGQSVHFEDPIELRYDDLHISANPGPATITSLSFADAGNGDTFADLVVASSSAAATVVLMGKGDGTFQTFASTPATPNLFPRFVNSGEHVIGAVVGDVNADDLPDISVLSWSASGASNIQIQMDRFLTRMDGGQDQMDPQLVALVPNSNTSFPGEILLADSNADGEPDIVVADYFNQSVRIYPGRVNDASATGIVQVTVSGSPTHVAATDLNADGQVDLVTSNTGTTNTLSYLLNTTTTASSPLKISAAAASASDPTAGEIVRAGEDLVFTLTVFNNQADSADDLQVRSLIPRYRSAQDGVERQFEAAELVLPAGAEIYTTGTINNGVAQKGIRWPAFYMAPLASSSVSYTVHITPKVAVSSTIKQQNDYEVSSLTRHPPGVATRSTSEANSLNTRVSGPIKFTAVAGVNTVAPGGYIDLTFTIENLTTVTQKYAAMVVDVPDFTRFAGYGRDRDGVLLAKPKGFKAAVVSDGTHDQVLIYPGKPIKSGASFTAVITVQAIWADPALVPGQKIGVAEYHAAFLTKATGAAFLSFIKKRTPGDYSAFLDDPTKPSVRPAATAAL